MKTDQPQIEIQLKNPSDSYPANLVCLFSIYDLVNKIFVFSTVNNNAVIFLFQVGSYAV